MAAGDSERRVGRAGRARTDRVPLSRAGDYLRNGRGRYRSSVQGITDNRYWLRVVNEEIDPTHVRDQTVLRDAHEWMATRDPSSPLPQGLCGYEGYAEVWEHF